MTQPGNGPLARHDAVAALFETLDALVTVYRSTPDADRVARWSADAERITGEVARTLGAARARLSSTIPHLDDEPTPAAQR